ncbi:hypothetical protein BDU57DRAFT_51485 [Ampelomyces quisqualis]|uniref:Uncharacterized protein n=1 Tax=Ampelomyces quisqualis TaxID=50730 RepID=A0A6A5R2W1_AMPQU|nr:hypothetical protein BDU57DRAFT_51485 [Ampelomyces quisqualis]
MPASPSSSSTQPSSSPFEPPLSPHAPLPKIIHLVDIVYPESYLRTPLPLVPSAQQHSLEQHLPSPNLSFSDTDTVRESVETDATHGYVGEVDVWGGGMDGRGEESEERLGMNGGGLLYLRE